MSRSLIRTLCALALGVLVQACVIIPIMPFSSELREVELRPSTRLFPKKILLVDIEGFLSTRDEGGLFGGPSMIASLDDQLNRAKKDSQIKAVVLRINSPGGTVTASDMMYRRVLKFREETSIPVYVAMMDLTASGGYYIAMAADALYAEPTSIVGSISVVAFFPEGEDLMNKIGIRVAAIKSGEMKDIGSIFRHMKPEEQKILQGIVSDMHDQFVSVVEKGRPKLSPEKIRSLADGRVFTAKRAAEEGLIDGVARLDEVIEKAEIAAGTHGARVVAYRRGRASAASIYATSADVSPEAGSGSAWNSNAAGPLGARTGAGAMGAPAQVNLINIDAAGRRPTQPGFHYYWMP